AIKVTPDEVEITEEQVEEALEGLRHSQAYWQPAERPCRLDDIVVLDIRGEVEGEPLFDEKERWYRLTSEATWPAPGFVQQVLGMNKGEGKEFVLPLPADFPESQFAGKECHFKVFLHEVKEENIPELNDDFAKSLDWEVNSLEELRGKMKARLRERAEQEAKSKLEREVLEALVGFSEVEFPPILVEMEIDQLIGEELRRRGWPSLEDFLRNLGKSEEELREELRPLAEERLTRSLVLGKVAEQENIRVGESEIEAEIERLSASAGERREELRQLLSSRGRESIRNELLTRKTLERLVEIALKEEPEGPAEQTSEN
ncbi:MAG: trigger factor, partial [Chloroflexi bacterium]